jgi:hypothetical protein
VSVHEEKARYAEAFACRLESRGIRRPRVRYCRHTQHVALRKLFYLTDTLQRFVRSVSGEEAFSGTPELYGRRTAEVAAHSRCVAHWAFRAFPELRVKQ